MPEYDIKLKIVEILGSGECPSKYKVGDEFSYDDPNFCKWARHSLMPFATALRFGGEVPWREEDKDTMNISCPDGDNPVVYKLTRTLKK
jgi:uncharacterized repeat protein (TIGR04076 family)